MQIFKLVCMNMAFFGFFLAAVTFGVLSPWYKTVSGAILFAAQMDFAILLGIVWTGYYAPEWPPRQWLIYGIYPLTAITGFAMTVVILQAQRVGRTQQRPLDTQLFTKRIVTEDIEPPWDGHERRGANDGP